MGNSQSMNNLSLIDHRRQNTEFLRYSQIPYERPPPPQIGHVNLREINNINGISNLPKPIKVLPDVNNLPKLRSTNNGAILQTCGTITARKDTECGLHRSKSISETNPDDLFAIPSHFKMQRASTQLSITHTSRLKENKIAESKIGNNQVVKSPMMQSQQPVAATKKSQFSAAERNSSRFMEKKMFGDTLKKQQELELRQSRPQLRREKTFDMTLIHTTSPHNEREKFTPKFSPQVQQKRMTTKTTADERNMKSTHNSAIKYDRPSDEKMKTIDRKFVEKKKGLAAAVSNELMSKNANEVSSSTKKYTKEVISKRSSPINKPQSIPKVALSPTKKSEPLKESKTSNNNSVKITQMIEKNQSQTDVAMRKFAEEVTKMSSAADLRQIQVQNDNEIDSDCANILISLRPTLPRRQLQIPHFSPTIAWKSLSTDVGDDHLLTDAQHLMSDDMGIEKKIEKVYIEPSFNLPFTDNKSGDSGISADKEIGNSAEMLQSSMPSAYMIPSWTPQQDLEDDDSSDQQEPENENFSQTSHLNNGSNLGENNQASFKGSMFSFSLPRDQCIEKIDCNNFYSLQKFKKADIFDSMTNLNESQFPSNSTASAADNNWLLGSQSNAGGGKISINESCEKQRSQIISQMKNGRHVMYLPNSRVPPNEVKVTRNSSIEKEYYESEHVENVNLRSPSSKNHKFKFQSTIRVTERKKMAEKLSREAEEKEMQRLCELEAMKKVEEEFQKKRLREKNRLRQQLRITSLESQHFDHNPRYSERRSNDTQTPYVQRIVESKLARRH